VGLLYTVPLRETFHFLPVFFFLVFSKEVTLAGNFADITDVALWLFECSTALSPVSCTSIRAGTIIVNLVASNKDDLDNVVDLVLDNGLRLPTFGDYAKTTSKFYFCFNLIFFLPQYDMVHKP
jgi:hypothetical protein